MGSHLMPCCVVLSVSLSVHASEMAMVLRMSMEEERQRQQKAAGTAPAATAGGAPAAAAAPMEEDEEALLAQAIALSMQENAEAPMADVPAADAPAASAAATPAAAAAAAAPASAASAADIDLAMQDPDFINSLLAGVSGADGQSVDVRHMHAAHKSTACSADSTEHSLGFVSLCTEPAGRAHRGRRKQAKGRQQEGGGQEIKQRKPHNGRRRVAFAPALLAALLVILSAQVGFQSNNKQFAFSKTVNDWTLFDSQSRQFEKSAIADLARTCACKERPLLLFAPASRLHLDAPI